MPTVRRSASHGRMRIHLETLLEKSDFVSSHIRCYPFVPDAVRDGLRETRRSYDDVWLDLVGDYLGPAPTGTARLSAPHPDRRVERFGGVVQPQPKFNRRLYRSIERLLARSPGPAASHDLSFLSGSAPMGCRTRCRGYRLSFRSSPVTTVEAQHKPKLAARPSTPRWVAWSSGSPGAHKSRRVVEHEGETREVAAQADKAGAARPRRRDDQGDELARALFGPH